MAEIALRLAISGTPVQRAAFARHLSPAACLNLPTIEILGKSEAGIKKVVGLIVASLENLAAHYGTTFAGDLQSVAYTISQDYAGFSVADLLLFFENAKSGKFRQEFQHMGKGINYDFLGTWLKQYAEERGQVSNDLSKQYKEPKPPTDPAELAADQEAADKVAEILAEMDRTKASNLLNYDSRQQIELQVQDLRNAWERELYETQLLRQWYKHMEVQLPERDEKTGNTVQVKRRKEMLCDENDSARERYEEYPIRVARPGATVRLMKRAIFDYVAFGDTAKAKKRFAQLVANLPEASQKARMKNLLIELTALQRNLKPRDILRATIQHFHPKASEVQVDITVRAELEKAEDMYYQHLCDCIATKYPALQKYDYLWQLTLLGYVQAGHENPAEKLIFNLQP